MTVSLSELAMLCQSFDAVRGVVSDAEYPRRIALFIAQLLPGGAERVVVHLAAALRDVGAKPFVICIKHTGVLAAELTNEGIPLLALESRRGYDFTALVKLTRKLREFRPSVIHVHDYASLPYAVLANKLGPRCPLVFTAHGLLYQGFDRLRRRNRLFARGIDSLAAVSPQVRDRHVAYLNWRGETRLVPNGVPDIQRDVESRCCVREEMNVPSDAFVFLSVGNPRPEKGFEDLVTAAQHLRQRHPDRAFHVWIAGSLLDTDYCRCLQDTVASCGVAGFRLLGYRADTRRLYSAADALVIPSRSEGLPMVLLEAMTAGLPVIATRVGGIPGALPAECGLLVDPGQPQQLSGAMTAMLTMKREQRDMMGLAARRHAVAEYGVGKMVEEYLAMYAVQQRRRTKSRSQ